LGEGTNPETEAVAIKSNVSLAAPASELYKLDFTSKKPTLWVNFLSIAGVQGPLPTPYTETLIERIRSKDTAFRDFLDIFNHRLASLWHRLRKKMTPGFSQVEPEASAIGKTILQLAGVQSLEKKPETLDPKILLGYYHLLWSKPHSAEGLLCFIKSFFQIPAIIHHFQGSWNEAKEQDISRIGFHYNHNTLGRSMILGRRFWNQTASICLELGPLKWQEFLGFLPQTCPTSPYVLISQITQLYCAEDTTITLKLKTEEAEPTFLNRTCALGHTTWIPSRQKKEACLMVRLPTSFSTQAIDPLENASSPTK
jgi:type VI secretion system protein ImpH